MTAGVSPRTTSAPCCMCSGGTPVTIIIMCMALVDKTEEREGGRIYPIYIRVGRRPISKLWYSSKLFVVTYFTVSSLAPQSSRAKRTPPRTPQHQQQHIEIFFDGSIS